MTSPEGARRGAEYRHKGLKRCINVSRSKTAFNLYIRPSRIRMITERSGNIKVPLISFKANLYKLFIVNELNAGEASRPLSSLERVRGF